MAQGYNNIIFEGRLPDNDLKSLLSRARGVLFPAYEDFGIVPVEAMAAGLPVVVFNQGGAAETVLPEFGEHITAQTPDELVAAVQRLETKTYDPDALKAHAEKFSEERFRGELLDAIEAAIERGPNRRFIE
jgi:glycosyltransferase involved in cell wall biosynthesis